MHNNIFLTDEQINEHFAKVLDVSLLTDNNYQALVASHHRASDMVNALHLPDFQWQIVDDYADAAHKYFAAYATAAYRLGFKDGMGFTNPSILNAICLGIANLLLDTFENGTVPISWQPSDRPELVRTIANVLANLVKRE